MIGQSAMINDHRAALRHTFLFDKNEHRDLVYHGMSEILLPWTFDGITFKKQQLWLLFVLLP
jgi:hypothetical protein